ncbi:MAG: hypothetical protein JRC87_07625 [Deltaproteobacteria bacterium]|nr:hypothetical protein [Deltaproteobacteria bacterium]MBW2659443.1 hypothetical protein [Deltaproteobacteria bacterium]
MIRKVLVVMAGLAMLGMVGCNNDKPKTVTEKAKEAVHDAVESTEEVAHDAGVATKEAVHDASEATKEAAHDAKKAVE